MDSNNDIDSQILNNEPYMMIYDKNNKDEDSIVNFVKRISSYDYDVSETALYI